MRIERYEEHGANFLAVCVIALTGLDCEIEKCYIAVPR